MGPEGSAGDPGPRGFLGPRGNTGPAGTPGNHRYGVILFLDIREDDSVWSSGISQWFEC